MLLRVRLVHILLGHLLHHHVGVDVNVLAQHASRNSPLAGDGEGAQGRLRVDLQ